MDLSKEKILILGASSHAGKSLCSYLLNNNNNIRILGTYNSNEKFLRLLENENRNFQIIKIDLNKNSKKILNVLKKYKPSLIIDFASNCNVEESWHRTLDIFRINLISKIQILLFLKNKNYLRKYIYISTPEIFGSNNKKIKEYEKKFNPSSPYATSKLSCELVMSNFCKYFKFPLIICRFANFYGNLQPKHRLMPALIKSAKSKKLFYLQGSGEFVRSFIIEYDFCRIIEKVIKQSKKGQIFHFSGKKFYSIKNIVNKVYKKYNLNIKKYLRFSKPRISQDKVYKLSDRLSREKIAYKDNYELIKNLEILS